MDKAQQPSSPSSSPSPQSCIVRLKGGDPFVFGRGGEEAEFLRQHGVPFVIIPGITAGIAAPAYAGIPVTHRDFASTITLITGHERDDAPVPEAPPTEPRVNYEALAKLGGTLVFYMGVKSLPVICSRLMAAGMNSETPAAVIRWGTRPEQQTLTATLSTLAEKAAVARIKPPAITLVGAVVSLRPTLEWFESRPLFGKTVVVTRTRQQASELSAKLSALGAKILEIPTIELCPPAQSEWPAIDQSLQQIPTYNCVIFTSPNGVHAAWDRLRYLGLDARHFPAPPAGRVAALGSATAAALDKIGISPDLLPDKFTSDDLAIALRRTLESAGGRVENQRFLLLRADIARPVLREQLQKLGGIVDDVPIYHTRRPDRLPADLLAAIEALPADACFTFTSASTATNLWQLLSPPQRQIVARTARASIGPITSDALRSLGTGEWSPTLEASTHNLDGIASALLNQNLNR